MMHRTLLLTFFPLLLAAADSPLAATRFELHKGLVFADFTVNGKTLNMAVDTGSPRSTVDLAAAGQLGLDIAKTALSSGPHTQSGPLQVHVAENVTFGLGQASVTTPVTVVYALDFVARRIGRPMYGIVGMDVLGQFVAEIDYPRGEIRLHKPGSFHPARDARIVPINRAGDKLRVRGAITAAAGSKPIEGDFELDTGAAGVDVVLWERCAGPDVLAAASDLHPVTSTAFGGDRKASEGHLARFTLADIVVDQPKVRITDVRVSGDAPSDLCGNVGSGLFRRFNTVFDLTNSRLILQ